MPKLTRQGVRDAIVASARTAAVREVPITGPDGPITVPFRVYPAEAETRLGALIGAMRASGAATDDLGWDVVRTAIRFAVVDDQGREIFDSSDLVGQWLETLTDQDRAAVYEAAQWVLATAGLRPPDGDDDPDAGADLVEVGKGPSGTTPS